MRRRTGAIAFVLLRMGTFLGEKFSVDDALKGYYWHEELLQDSRTNLFYHGYDEGTKGHMSSIFPRVHADRGTLRDSALVRLQGWGRV